MIDEKTSESFGKRYSYLYDSFYPDKPYKQESEFIKQLLEKNSDFIIKDILDMGCGTGRHILELSKMGYNLTGIDASKDMIEIARKKIEKEGLNSSLQVMKFQNIALPKRFDAIICMFHALDYVTNIEEIKEVFIRVKKHLKKGGLFLFDFRNEKPSLMDYDPKRVAHVQMSGKDLFRISLTKVDSEKKLCETTFECFVINGKRLEDRFKEQHIVRFFSIDEMKKCAESAGLTVKMVCPFLKTEKKVTDEDWTICMVVKND